jgi:hypothetical protein
MTPNSSTMTPSATDPNGTMGTMGSTTGTTPPRF